MRARASTRATTGFSLNSVSSIVARSRTLYDWLDGGAASAQAPADGRAVEQRLAQWAARATGGDRYRLEKRLGWDGLTTTVARVFLASDSGPIDAAELPAWARTLGAVSAYARRGVNYLGRRDYRFFDADEPVPYEHIHAPLVAWAARQCWASLGNRAELLLPGAQAALERWLLRELCGLSVWTLQMEFAAFRAGRETPFARLLRQSTDPAGHELYDEFVGSVLVDGLQTVLDEYPVLARLIATTIDLWREMVQEFVGRLDADLPQIRHVFNDWKDLGRVCALGSGLSDPHYGRRTVIGVAFECGLRVVYKPKPLQLEAAFSDFVQWCNRAGLQPTLRPIRIVPRDGYGWAEYLAHDSCSDLNAARRFYQRSGALLCVAYLLQGNDLHGENVLAAGEKPALLDLETLFHPFPGQPVDPNEPQAWERADEQIWCSVLRTNFLPHWAVDVAGESVDTGAVAVWDGEDTESARPGWRWINSDAMAFGRIPVRKRLPPNLPVFDGKVVPPERHIEALVEGFRATYRFLLQHRQLLLDRGGPLSRFRDLPTRFIFRSTHIYGMIADRLLHPEYLRSGVDFSIHLDALARAYAFSDETPSAWPLVRAEERALLQMDVPAFATTTSSTDLWLPDGQVVDSYFAASGYERALVQLANLDADDLERQTGYIRASFAAMPLRLSAPETGEEFQKEPSEAPLSNAELLRTALEIAADLRSVAVRSSDGSAAWVGLEFDPEIERFDLRPLGQSLYSGNAGIALFLAAAERCAPGEGFGALALAAVQRLRSDLTDPKSGIWRHVPLGGFVGLGSIVYALTCMSELLVDGDLLDSAHDAARRIGPEKIQEDRRLDVLTGSAGALLSLLVLLGRSGESWLLDLAVACGEHLLASRVPSAAGPNAWPTFQGRFLTGFSHGASGIAYALSQLHRATGDSRFAAAAAEGIAYERALFVPDQGNWLDLRPSAEHGDEPKFAVHWCNGATGIGLARLCCLDAVDDPGIRNDLDVALGTTMRAGPSGLDHLCCGVLGRADFLFEAGNRLKREDLVEQARAWAGGTVRRARASGAFHLTGTVPAGNMSPGLLQGTAGIGYALLRLASAEPALPSVLALA